MTKTPSIMLSKSTVKVYIMRLIPNVWGNSNFLRSARKQTTVPSRIRCSRSGCSKSRQYISKRVLIKHYRRRMKKANIHYTSMYTAVLHWFLLPSQCLYRCLQPECNFSCSYTTTTTVYVRSNARIAGWLSFKPDDHHQKYSLSKRRRAPPETPVVPTKTLFLAPISDSNTM